MGVYYSQFAKPCPACGVGTVVHTFISVSPMSSHIRCSNCGKEDWTHEETQALGKQESVYLS